jgi:hypothetical protein
MAQAIQQPKHTVVPYLRVKGAAKAVELYAKPNGAVSIHLNVPDCDSVFQQMRKG